MAPKAHEKQAPTLPLLVVGPVDLGRLIRELEAIEEHMHQTELRTKQPAQFVPRLSMLLEQTVELNKVDLRLPEHRKALAQFLLQVRDQAPLLHISFSSDPNVAFLEKFMAWLRREIHPAVMVTIGIQPNIAAGCIVRTTNKQFDCSLRKHFDESQHILTELLSAGQTIEGVAQVPQEQPA